MAKFHRYQPAAEEVWNQGYPVFEKDPDYYHKWWKEQIRRCILGYEPKKGDWISGAYYFHLNFARIQRYDEKLNDKAFLPPLYRDIDHEYYQFLKACEDEHMGALVLKARRKGFSVNSTSFLYHRWNFFQGTEIGVGAYDDDDVIAVRRRIGDLRAFLPKELYKSALFNDEILEARKEMKGDAGFVNEGDMSRMYFRCFAGRKGKAGAFRGLSLKVHYFEEIGKNPILLQCLEASRDCWKEGQLMYGLPILGGTGDKMTNPSPDLERIAYAPEDYGLKLHFIPAAKWYYTPGKEFINEQTGKSSVEAAQPEIDKEYKRLHKMENKTSYYSFLQENPSKLEHVFMGNSMSSLLPLDYVNRQIEFLRENITMEEELRWFDLRWKGGKFNPQKPEVEYVPCEKYNGPYCMAAPPINAQYKNLDIAGVDTFFHSGGSPTGSKGVMFVYRRYNPFDSSMPCELPIAYYVARTQTTEEFYDNCLKLSVFYNCKMLAEYDEAFGNFMKNCNALRFFKERPVAADSDLSTATNKYMIHMKVHQKELATKLTSDYITNHWNNIKFLPLLEDFKKYGRANTDFTMAFAIALIHDLDNSTLMVVDMKSEGKEDTSLPTFKWDEKGRVVPTFTIGMTEMYESNKLIDLSHDF
jgi:hypothetical protein